MLCVKCTYCGESFDTSEELNKHLNISYCEKQPKPEFHRMGDLTSTKCPQFHLIPTSAMFSETARFELGEIKHGQSCWNAKYPHRLTEEFVIERLNHVIKHAKLALDKILKISIEDGDDDAGAIRFGGAVLAEWHKIKKQS